ncbi:MAG: PIN domain nuclease [Spirochaetes bacterium]|nr:PIN domain nuclease [Spirochaetota bacterium]
MIVFIRIMFLIITASVSWVFLIQLSIIHAAAGAAGSAVVALAFMVLAEYTAHSFSVRQLFSVIFGLLTGLVVSFFASAAFSVLPLEMSEQTVKIAQALIYHLITYGIIIFFIVNNEDIALFDKILPPKPGSDNSLISYKILDTSVIIDGRISDICDTGFLEGVLVIPNFVLNELQMIADSADSIKRNRGRRGLDILNKMQKDQAIKVKISDMDFPEIHEVDSKLVKLAKVMNAKVVTNDFNLNKVAEFHGVDVLNINQLSNALKPVVLPGEEMRVSLIKEGKDPDQAIGYLDDGTMVVIEDGRSKLNAEVSVIVTSVLQTTAGRMIFGKIKNH